MKTHEVVKIALDAWGIPFSDKFLSPDGLVVAALLCNAAAKQIDPDYYDIKPLILEAAAMQHLNTWYDRDQGILYFETLVGQLSFHVFADESDLWELLPPPHHRQWRGGYMQDYATDIALAFMYDDPLLELRLRRFLNKSQH